MRIARTTVPSLIMAAALALAAAPGPARADGLDDFFSSIRRQFDEPARPSRSQSCAQTEAEAHVLATTADSDLGRVKTRIDRIERDAGAGTARDSIDQATQVASQAQGLSAKLRRAQAAYRTIIGQCGRPDLQSERLGSLARRLDAEARRANRLADRIASTPTGALPGGPQACPALVDDAQSVQADTAALLDRIGKRLGELEGADPLAARTGALGVADDIAEQRQRVDTIDARAATQGPDCAEAAAIRDRAAGDRQSLQALQNQADTLIGPPAPDGAEPTLTTAQRRKVQERLAALGHYRSQVDGRFGDGTRRAIALYQRAGGAAATGRLTPAQADALLADPATAPPRPLVQQAPEPAAKPEGAAPAAQPAPAAAAAEPPPAPPETAAAPAPETPAPAEAPPPAAAPEAQAAQAAPDAAPPKPDAPPAAPPASAATESPATTTAASPAASVAAPAPATDAPAAAAPPPPAVEAPAAQPAPAAEPAPATPIAPTQPAEPPADANMVPSARVAARLIEALRRWPQPPVVTAPPAPDAAPAAPDPFAELYARLRGHAANGEMPAVQAGRYELVGMALLEHGAESTQMLDADLLLVQAAQALDARDEARHGLAAAAPLIGRLGSGESRRSRQSLEAATAWLGLRIVAADLLEAITTAKAEPLDGTTADRMSERLDQIEQVMAQAQDGVDELAAQALFLRAAVLASAGRMPDDAELKAEIDRLLK